MEDDEVVQDVTANENLEKVRNRVHLNRKQSLLCGNTEAVMRSCG
jgi:hypothetical protein